MKMVNRTSLRSGSTAQKKRFKCGSLVDCSNDEWKTKDIRDWSTEQIFQWMQSVAKHNNVNYEKIKMRNFINIDGLILYEIKVNAFQDRDPNFGGILFKSLQQLKSSGVCSTYTSEEEERLTKKWGRPRGPKSCGIEKKKKTRCCLWQFLLDLLSQPEYCPSVVSWENCDEGLFRMVQSDKIVKLWGGLKGNGMMDYAKMTRLMRYYHEKGILEHVKQRLVYKFGEKTSWKTYKKV